MAVDLDAFARDWLQAWNDHDLDAVLGFYADEALMRSPRISLVLGAGVDTLKGKAALRDYWEAALETAQGLFFDMDGVFRSADAVTLLYTNHRDQQVAETFIFNAEGLVVESVAAYA
ncbi:MAG: nuclear transport factor 2 family protein [Pseudomonadota bacterium]